MRLSQKSCLTAKHTKFAQSTQRQSIDIKLFANFALKLCDLRLIYFDF